LRRTKRRCAWATVSMASWRSINSQNHDIVVAQPQHRIWRRKLVNTKARSWWWRPLILSPSSVIASCLARSPSTLGAIRKKNTRDPKCLARSTCLYLQPTGGRMVTTLPTESQRYREYGLSSYYLQTESQRSIQQGNWSIDDMWKPPSR